MEARVITPGNETGTLPNERLVDNFKLVARRAGQKARERAQAAEEIVRGHPYQTIGIAIGLGVLIGALARHRWAMRG